MEEREMLHLVWSFLCDRNLNDTARFLEKESQFDVTLPPRGVKVSPLQQILDRHHEDRLRQSMEAPVASGQDGEAPGKTVAELRREDEDLLNTIVVADDFELPRGPARHTLVDLHSQNPLVVRFSADTSVPMVATGGADRVVTLTDAETGSLVGSYTHHKAGVLALDFHPIRGNLLLTSSMDGSHALLDVDRDGPEALLATWKDHTKFVVRIKWSPDGNFFATASYDKNACLYSFNQANNEASLLHRFHFRGPVEAIAFTLDSKYLVLSSRDDNYLHYVALPSLKVTKFNMNLNGDDFVSFTPMEFAFHPTGKYLAVSTDKSRIILFRTFSVDQVTNIYGVVGDSLTQPRLAWHPSGRYLFANQENTVCVIEISSQKVIDRLKEHTGIVRDLHFHPSKNLLVTASYDRTFKVWSH